MPTIPDDLIDTHRDINVSHDWWDFTFQDFDRVCDILGIDLDRYEPQFSGFHSQGDGASWVGVWGSYDKQHEAIEHAPQEIRKHYTGDDRLHHIADTICMLNRMYFRMQVTLTRVGRYVHDGTMYADVSPYDISEDDAEEQFDPDVWHHLNDTVQDLARDLAGWLYERLEEEFEYLTSDDAVRESIIENDLHKEPE